MLILRFSLSVPLPLALPMHVLPSAALMLLLCRSRVDVCCCGFMLLLCYAAEGVLVHGAWLIVYAARCTSAWSRALVSDTESVQISVIR